MKRWPFLAIALATVGLTVCQLANVSPRSTPTRLTASDADFFELRGRSVKYRISKTTGLLQVRSLDHKSTYDVALSVTTPAGDAALVPHTWPPNTVQSASHKENEIALAAVVDNDGVSVHFDAVASFSADEDRLTITLASPQASDASQPPIAIRAELVSEGLRIFVAGKGLIADIAEVEGPITSVSDGKHPIAFVGTRILHTSMIAPKVPDEVLTLRVQSEVATPAGERTLTILAPESREAMWSTAYRRLGPTKTVQGIVTGTKEPARVIAQNDVGEPFVDFLVPSGISFAIDVPAGATLWYAALDATQTSAPVHYTPGSEGQLTLDISPGGTLDVHIRDPDTDLPLTARLIVRGEAGTPDPNFGPDFRASGAGPIIDSLRGQVSTPLPAGRYRISATKGVEYTIDVASITIDPAKTTVLELHPRHVVDTTGLIGCDLHVHARPSFDAPVTPEDRVTSLVAAGIDFAVPTEHNIVGDYAPALNAIGLANELAQVPGVEVTTFGPRFGHFGVFPYSPRDPVPPYKQSSPNQLFNAVRKGHPERFLQVNHPRMRKDQVGYFDDVGISTKLGKSADNKGRMDFDGLEVMNGFETGDPKIAERILVDYFNLLNLGKRHYVATGSSDSHRILYGWAGYPRTFVHVAPEQAGDTGQPVDPQAVVRALRDGHVSVSGGPIAFIGIGTAIAGDQVRVENGDVHVSVRVQAAPWIDVSSVEIIVNGRSAWRSAITKVPERVGPEPGTLAEAKARSIRFEADVPLKLRVEDTWILVVARGDRRIDDVLPNTPILPLAFTNPIWLTH